MSRVHPELSKRMVLAQLAAAEREPGTFGERFVLEEVGYPSFYVRAVNRRGREYVLHFDCVEYDFQPIAIEFVHPITRALLAPREWPVRRPSPFPIHTATGRPFLCLEGTRDFYMDARHSPAKTGVRWEQHRPEYKIADLLRVIRGNFWTGAWS